MRIEYVKIKIASVTVEYPVIIDGVVVHYASVDGGLYSGALAFERHDLASIEYSTDSLAFYITKGTFAESQASSDNFDKVLAAALNLSDNASSSDALIMTLLVPGIVNNTIVNEALVN